MSDMLAWLAKQLWQPKKSSGLSRLELKLGKGHSAYPARVIDGPVAGKPDRMSQSSEGRAGASAPLTVDWGRPKLCLCTILKAFLL